MDAAPSRVYTEYMTPLPKYLFLDLETTGLDPSENQILECAALVVTADLCASPSIDVDCVLRRTMIGFANRLIVLAKFSAEDATFVAINPAFSFVGL